MSIRKTPKNDPIREQADSKGLLVVSFGTSHNETCEETIAAIEKHLAKAMAGRRLYRAWTSRFIIRKLRERDGVEIDTVEEALVRMADDGIRDVLVVPTHMLGGAEYDKVLAAVDQGCRSGEGGATTGDGSEAETYTFDRISISRPLLDSDEDIQKLAAVIADELLECERCGVESRSADEPPEGADAALVLMGHGSADRPEVNRVYHKLEEEFRRAGHDNVFVGTVEGSPTIDDVIGKLVVWRSGHVAGAYDSAAPGPAAHPDSPAAEGAELPAAEAPEAPAATLLLAPLMIVAGDHAVNDMAGEGPDSWKNRIAAALCGQDPAGQCPAAEVIPILRGLGSYPGVQQMYADHAAVTELRPGD